MTSAFLAGCFARAALHLETPVAPSTSAPSGPVISAPTSSTTGTPAKAKQSVKAA